MPFFSQSPYRVGSGLPSSPAGGSVFVSGSGTGTGGEGERYFGGFTCFGRFTRPR